MPTIPESEMPVPRLELRWVDLDPETPGPYDGARPYTCKCVYSLVLRLGKWDIRADRGDNSPNYHEDGEPLADRIEHKTEIGSTLSTGEAATRYHFARDTVHGPFRDGAHAAWDSRQLGDLPVYAVAAGRAELQEKRERVE